MTVHNFCDLAVNDIYTNMKLYNIEYYSNHISEIFKNKSILNFKFSMNKRNKILRTFTPSLCFFCCKYEVMFEITFFENYVLEKIFETIAGNYLKFSVKDITTKKSFLLDSNYIFDKINKTDSVYLKKFLKLFSDLSREEKNITRERLKNNVYIRNLEQFFYCVCFVIFKKGLTVEEEKNDQVDLFDTVKKFRDQTENTNISDILEFNLDTLTKSVLLYVFLSERKKQPFEFKQFLKNVCFSEPNISFEEFKNNVLNGTKENQILINPEYLVEYGNSLLLKLDWRTVDCFITLVFNYIQKKRTLLWQREKPDYLKILMKSKFLEIGKHITVQNCRVFHTERYTSSVFFIKIYDKNYNVFSFVVKEREVLKKFPLFRDIPEVSGVVNALIRDNNVRENGLTKVNVCSPTFK